ncbi:Dihydropteroate synthase [Microlunatus sagamiharensis]|uniref:Dihydropteroate synthase n=1 Tax=Microlunatus sagamiharensis TaxID=546874 RepID=A0A1H2MF75_9ACTN|nr:dihydropteroate synthase [Microlunatus sagamiharensis]SDU91561.1 Dihydropteroate synthase [Microlunatus sagamiharensis]
MVYLPPLRHPRVTWGPWSTDFSRRVLVMGIVNRTPDSFFDAGRTYGLERAVDAVLAAAEAGADWVDVGGVPFSPDAADVPVAEEVDRVVPVVAGATARSDVVISVDTYRPEVAREAIAAGALVVNDTTGLRDPELADVVAATGAGVVITHSLAAPRTHLRRPRYDDVVDEVKAHLASRVQAACDRGVAEDRIVIDPGHDLNKNTRHSLELTRRLPEIADLGLPLLAAVSNKDFVGESTGLAKPERLAPSLAAASACVLGGARVLRMHDVAASVAAARMLEAVLGLREPEELRHNVD